MRLTSNSVTKSFCLLLMLILSYSCSKDADLLSEYVVSNNQDQAKNSLVVNDIYYVTYNESTILDVLNNDSFENITNVKVTNISSPEFGSVVINEDNTLTYTPIPPEVESTDSVDNESSSETNSEENQEEEIVDTFVYVAEETNEEGDTTSAEATVTVNVSTNENKMPTTGTNVFYVTAEGKSSNNGKAESSAWDIEHGFKAAKAGDIVYIKAGNYGNKNLIVKNPGTEDKPISFIGYKETPGDISSLEGSTFSYGDNLDSTYMPLIKGNRNNQEGIGEGIIIYESNIHLSNIQITHFEKGLLSYGDNNVLDNIVITEIGDFNPLHSKENSGDAFLNYNGKGITLEGDSVILKNSIVINAGAEGISVRKGTNQIHSYNSVYSDNSTNPCDYYYLFSNETSYNTIENIIVYRDKNLSHYGHGIICKGDTSNNIFKSFEINNTVLEISMEDSMNNLFENGIIKGEYNRIERKNRTGGILIANGANNNILRNINIYSVESAISFGDWNGENSYSNKNDAGNNNSFINIYAEDTKIGVNFDEFMNLKGIAHNNQFKNCEFRNMDQLFHVNRPNSLNKFENCIFENIDIFEATSSGYDYKLNTNTIFSEISSINLGFDLP